MVSHANDSQPSSSASRKSSREDSPRRGRRLSSTPTNSFSNENVPPSTSSPSSIRQHSQKSRDPPPIPSRPRQQDNQGSGVGSSHTKSSFVPDGDSSKKAQSRDLPPDYHTKYVNPDRNPGFLVTDEDDEVPGLVPTTSVGVWDPAEQDQSFNQWSDSSNFASNDFNGASWNSSWGNTATGITGTDYTSPYASSWTYEAQSVTKNFRAFNREFDEEIRWWDSYLRLEKKRPGDGFLPPLLASSIHPEEPALYSVTISDFPEVKQAPAPATSASQVASSSSPPPTSPPPHDGPHTHSPHVPPTEDEVRRAIPHPNAYYCKEDNAWILMLWTRKPTSSLPALSKSFAAKLRQSADAIPTSRSSTSTSADKSAPTGTSTCKPLFFPSLEPRKRPEFCGQQPDDLTWDMSSSLTHHFHHYSDAVDGANLFTPYHRPAWENQDQEEGQLLDLYVCCQCPFYVVASKPLPGVIPGELLNKLIKEKAEAPMPGKNGAAAAAVAIETLMTIIHNRVFAGNTRLLLTTKPKFLSALGVNETVDKILTTLGFTCEPLTAEENRWRPPLTEPINSQGKANRAKMLRGWVELGAWLYEHTKQFANKFEGYSVKKMSVTTSAEREHLQSAVGAHPSQMERWRLPSDAQYIPEKNFTVLGLSPSTASPEFLAFAYLAQCRCDPAKTMTYFSALSNIVFYLQAECDQNLQSLVIEERERSRFSLDDLANATAALGFSIRNQPSSLGIEYSTDIEDEFIRNAWMDVVKRSWRELESAAATRMQKDATDALRMIAESRGSVYLRSVWEKGCRSLMSPEKAYDTLEVPHDTDEEMLVVVYGMRLQESPHQREKWSDALSVIAETRDSERLRGLAATGNDPGYIVPELRKDLPRGLHQLGNTCYLNSLLQYFYTIKDLRETVGLLHGIDPMKDLGDDKLTEEDIKSQRVGGRLVTRREIMRSRKFVSHLAELFFKMENSDEAAVTPSIDLAKLALVTSRDEEEEEADKGGTDSSNDTDATLVDEVPPRFGPHLPRTDDPIEGVDITIMPPDTVMGSETQSRGLERPGSAMDIDEPAENNENVRPPAMVQGSHVGSSSSVTQASSETSTPPITSEPVAQGDDIEMTEVAPKSVSSMTRKPTDSGSVMMFGKQHDVSECMDNCMFQIETALLKFDALSGQQEDNEKTSIVKRLFYGKIRQRVSLALDTDSKSRASVHEKEDLFSHLPVNVTDDGWDIYDGLSGYFDDAVEFEGKKARMEMTLVELPPLLQIQLQRVQFNRETLQAYKSQAYVKFGETIYMDRYLDDVDSDKKARSKELQRSLAMSRERLRLLTQDKTVPYQAALTNTCDYLSKIDFGLDDIDDDLIAELSTESLLIEREVQELRSQQTSFKAELELLWSENKQAAYELTSVFIHRGSSPSWGHYFFFSRNLPGKPESWFKYNDAEVTEVGEEEVLGDTTGSTANPYLLVFARKGMGIVDTVNRYDLPPSSVPKTTD